MESRFLFSSTQVYSSCNQNETLKRLLPIDSIVEIINHMMKSYPNLDYSLLLNRIQTLQVSYAKQYVDRLKPDSFYMVEENEWRFSEHINQYDVKNVLTQILFEMTIIKEKNKGLASPDMEVIRRGMTQMYANVLVGNDAEKELYPEEHIIVNLMDFINRGLVSNAFLENDDTKIRQILLGNKGLDVVNQKAINNCITQSIVGNHSILGDIETDLVYIAKNQKWPTEVMENFLSNIYLRPEGIVRPFSPGTIQKLQEAILICRGTQISEEATSLKIA